ncbi:MAG TPA: hypothetical protein VL633_06930 [Bacteroidota bacterium]|jgi:hypothetical protein|nr:hypothetical protein [Bacteroidota bacterium]
MSILPQQRTSLVIRLVLTVALAAAAFGMYLMSRTGSRQPEAPPPKQEPSQASLSELDREVDAVLSKFKVDRAWVHKAAIPIPNSSLKRIERRIVIPPDIAPVQMNVSLNDMAKRYNARAVASENTKENTVTIHIELDGFLVETIVLRTDMDLKTGGKKGVEKKA